MTCESCDGRGVLRYRDLPPEERRGIGFNSEFPCPDCDGSGIWSCCEGVVGTQKDIELDAA